MKNWLREHYERRILPYLIEGFCSIGQIMKARATVVPQAQGRVLEMGIGTGLNLSFYDAAKVSSVTGVDPAPAMHQRARKRAMGISIPVETVALELGEIQADTHSFDTIVCTFTLCTIADVPGAFREMRRVIKPGGRFLFIEHGRAPDLAVARWQDRITPLWQPFAGGCAVNRDIPALIREGGFVIGELDARYHKGPKALNYIYRGWAC